MEIRVFAVLAFTSACPVAQTTGNTPGDAGCEELKRTVIQSRAEDPQKAEALLSAAVADGRRTCAGLALASLGNIASVRGRLESAEQYEERAIKLLETEHPADDPILLQPLEVLSTVTFDQGKFGKSRRVYERMLRIRAERPAEAALVHMTAAMLLQHDGKLEQAEREFLAAVSAREENGQHNTADTAMLLSTLGNLYLMQRRYTQAGAEVNSALAILAASSDAAPNDFVCVLTIRAMLYVRKGEWQAAEKDLLEAFSIVRQDKSESPLALRRLLQSYATVLRKTHRRHEARLIEREAAVVLEYPYAGALVDVTDLARRRPSGEH